VNIADDGLALAVLASPVILALTVGLGLWLDNGDKRKEARRNKKRRHA
jgi:hypothetical protein